MTTLKIEEARTRLAACGQAHVLRFWECLNAAQRDGLLAQVGQLDLATVARMQQQLRAPSGGQDLSGIRPAPVTALDAAGRQAARQVGEQLLREGKVGVVLVAGGQGSRLGFEGPKGAYAVGPVSNACLFAFHARKVLALTRRFGAPVPLYIMTSDTNDAETRDVFARQGHFGLSAEHVHFFMQGMLPALDGEGRMVLDRPDHLFVSPDGHGGTLAALRAAGMLDDMARRGLEELFYFQVDNPLVQVADPVFLGFHRQQGADVSVKVCAKRGPDEGLGVVVELGGRQAIVEYTELTQAQKHARRPDGRLLFEHGSVAIHAFNFAFLRRQADAASLPWHVAHKKVAICDDTGATVAPKAPNAYKFEKFIFDLLPLAARVVCLEFAREDEFSPVKNATGDDSPATCQRDITRKAARWLESVGVAVPRGADGEPRYKLEIDPAFANEPDDLRGKVARDLQVAGNLYLS